MTTFRTERHHWRLRLAMALPAVLLIGACASAPPPPEASLTAARQAIASAERADAARYAPAELTQARSEIASADAEVTAKRMVMADRLAMESRASAELASARTGAAKAAAMNDEIRAGTATLVEEMKRNTGDKR